MRFARLFDTLQPDDLLAREAWGGEKSRYAVCKQSFGARPMMYQPEKLIWCDFPLVLTVADLLEPDWVKVPR